LLFCWRITVQLPLLWVLQEVFSWYYVLNISNKVASPVTYVLIKWWFFVPKFVDIEPGLLELFENITGFSHFHSFILISEKHKNIKHSNKNQYRDVLWGQKDINTTNNCPKRDCKQADKNELDKNYNWLYRLSRTSSKFTVLRDLLNEENEPKSTLLGTVFQRLMTRWLKNDIQVFVRLQCPVFF